MYKQSVFVAIRELCPETTVSPWFGWRSKKFRACLETLFPPFEGRATDQNRIIRHTFRFGAKIGGYKVRHISTRKPPVICDTVIYFEIRTNRLTRQSICSCEDAGHNGKINQIINSLPLELTQNQKYTLECGL